MSLTQNQIERIKKFIPTFKNYLETPGREADLKERKERTEMYGQLLSPEGLEQMTELEFGQLIGSLWASLMWTMIGKRVERLLKDNSLSDFKKHLHELIWGAGSIYDRYDTFNQAAKGFGPAMTTEILAFTHPKQCGLWNDKARKALFKLGFQETFPLVKKYQITGQEYERFNELLQQIEDELQKHDLPIVDFLGVDYFLFEVWKARDDKGDFLPEKTAEVSIPTITDFDHDEVVDQLIAIGQWLGFDVEKEKLIAKGARVDAIWQAKIANLGVVTYIFEVHRRGSHDSLILNMQRAQNNSTVQRLIVVASQEEIVRIRQEIESLSEGFRRMVGYMEVTEAMRAAELANELSTIINKLELVKSEFGRQISEI